MMKDGIRVLGIDDASFSFEDSQTFLTGVVYRGTEFIEDIQTVDVDVDGYDATEKVVELFNNCDNTSQIRGILLDGISFAGFNIVDLDEVEERTGKPVVAVTPNEPDREEFRETMERTGNVDEVFEDLGEPREVELEDGTAYIQFSGCGPEEARELVRKSVIHGLTPEPVRVSHMIGRAMYGR
ncbi:MAG: DUF99 family protein [Candidatus Nanohaloarchaea archaeon]